MLNYTKPEEPEKPGCEEEAGCIIVHQFVRYFH